jgi:hypothetical protein
MTTRTLTIISSLLLAVCLHAETHLSGRIDRTELLADEGPFIVDSTLVIPPGASLRIAPGTILLFKPFAGIKVGGTLLVEGSAEQPVVFTSINDLEYSLQSTQAPNAFDWNGIAIHSQAEGVVMRHFILKYSVFGIKSQRDDIVIGNAMFWENGQFHFTINDRIMDVKQGFPFSHNDQAVSTAVNDSLSTAQKEAALQAYRRKMTRYITASGLLLAGVGALGAGGYYWLDAREHREAIETDLSLSRKQVAKENEDFEESRTRSLAALAAGGVVVPASIALYCVQIDTLFGKTKLKASAGIDGSMGLSLVGRF